MAQKEKDKQTNNSTQETKQKIKNEQNEPYQKKGMIAGALEG